jgi:Mlc titration factor MtfA (ptsG expression regulator)
MILFYQLFKSIADLWQELKILFGAKKLSREDIEVLNKLLPYFNALRPDHKKEFKERLLYFITFKEFIPRGDLKVISREMQLLIGATAIMVTFGFRNLKLKHFSRILVYPDDYYSTINKKYHQGEVNPRLGIIVLSWKRFVEGFLNPNDGINLGLHEMAHALKLENQIQYNGESNFFNRQAWEKFYNLAKMEMERINTNNDSFFRMSAGSNIHEFFAIAIESFFERPALFKEYNKELYKSLVFTLKQDPIVLKG